ncbi:MAG: hypothetical protein NTX79_05855 [Candidatus Micrarchaeota archaeon]|nr:hypothetical protein [Candidatus Micrarchaeota archaeon]
MANMKIVQLEKSNTNRFDADAIAKRHGGRIAGNAQIDEFILGWKYRGGSSFWAREFVAKGILVEKGKDLFCKEINVLVEANEISKAHEASKKGIIGKEGILLFIDPETLVQNKNGIFVLENPKITVFDNAILEHGYGIPDQNTRIAIKTSEPPEYKTIVDGQTEWHYSSPLGIRWNFFKDGVWPITRALPMWIIYGVHTDGRGVEAQMNPSTFIAQLIIETPEQ